MAHALKAQAGLDIYRRLLSYSLQHWPLLLYAIIGMAVAAATEPLFAALMKPLLDGSFVAQDPFAIRWLPLAIVAIFLARGLGSFVSVYFMATVGREVVKAMRSRMFGHLLHMPTRFFDHTSSGELLTKLTYHVEQLAAASATALQTLVKDGLTVLGLVIWMFLLNWVMALSFLLVGPVIAVLIAYVTQRFRKLSHRVQDSMGDVARVAQETIEGHRVIKIFDGERYETQQFEHVNERNLRQYRKLMATRAASTPVVQLLMACALAMIVFIATRDKVLQDISVGTFMSFITAALLLLQPTRRLTQINSLLQRGIAAGESIFDLLDVEREADRGLRSIERARGEIEYRDVHFRYSADKDEVLRGISLQIVPGQTVALVGASGSGKTTLVDLLPRFYEPQRGEVLLDGIDVSGYRLRDLRRQIAYVGQDVILFNDTIANNIAYGGLRDAGREQIRRAAEAAHALAFIDALPEGFDTPVGENGVLLSGGQRQRLAIARALLKDAPLLILDEATSALDTESERHIQAALETLLENRTTLVIAHRLSTIEKADQILVLQDGRVAEQGTHAQLLALDGHYANLYRMQFHEPLAS